MAKKLSGLTARAKAILREVSSEIEVTGRNRALAHDYCRCMEQVERLEGLVREEGIIVQGVHKSRVKNPALQVLRDYRTSAQQYARILGLNQATSKPEKRAPGERLLDENWKIVASPPGAPPVVTKTITSERVN